MPSFVTKSRVKELISTFYPMGQSHELWAIEKDFAMELTIEEPSQEKVTRDKRRHEADPSGFVFG